MSDFVDCEPGVLIPLGSTIQQMKDTIDSALTTRGYQAIRKRNPPTAWLGNMVNISSAFDLSLLTYAHTNGVSSPWTIGFQAPSAFTPTVLRIQGGYAAGNYEGTPKDFKLQYSDDGTNWYDQQSWTNEPYFYLHETRTYAIAGASGHAYWRLYITAKGTAGTYMGLEAIWLEDASGFSYSSSYMTDFIPPSSETIGNAAGFDFLRMTFSGSAIGLAPLCETKTALPQVLSFTGTVAGAVTSSITIGGATVSFVGSSGNTSAQNARGLFEACRDSANANFTALTWYYDAGVIFAKQTTPSGNLYPTVSNTTLAVLSHYSAAGPQHQCIPTEYTLSVDLTSGFIFFMQINKRGVALAHKLNAGFYGPVHACWGDHQKALDAVPARSGHPMAPPFIPIELLVGINTTDIAKATGAYRISHAWGAFDYSPTSPVNPEQSGSNNYGTGCNPFTSLAMKRALFDVWAGASSNHMAAYTYLAGGGGLFLDTEVGGDQASAEWPVHKLVGAQEWEYFAVNGYNHARVFAPAIQGIDWYRYLGTLNTEQIVASPVRDFNTTVSANCLSSDSTINVDSTSAFPASGTIVINGEVIDYSGKTASSFTGCLRGRKTSAANKHYVGDEVLICGFFIKINYGLIFCGYTEPS